MPIPKFGRDLDLSLLAQEEDDAMEDLDDVEDDDEDDDAGRDTACLLPQRAVGAPTPTRGSIQAVAHGETERGLLTFAMDASRYRWVGAVATTLFRRIMIQAAVGNLVEGQRPYTLECCAGVRDAVQAAARVVEPGDVVLLAPGGTSYDAFRDFEERGEAYRQWVQEF